ncbi:MAG: wax ester/triacylglycerol synthase family O-acyltransferase [Nitriliruptorales bacterium]|nr:wax ester/triacylglycerol synthase family O-acyltransferase [Nitriliruptorales bacterium]
MGTLSVADAGWLLIEGRERPMHVGGLMLFEPPEDAGPQFLQDLVSQVRDHTNIRPPFNQRLARPYGLAGSVYQWTEDEPELDYHFRHLALPEPGRIRELLVLVSNLHANLLDRHRPLWEVYLIEGIEDGRFALYSKVHHSVLDGVAAMKQVLRSFSDDPDVRDTPPPWAIPRGENDADDGGVLTEDRDPLAQARRILKTVAQGVTSPVGLTKALLPQFATSPFDPAEVTPFQAPDSMLNARLTASRRFVAQRYEFDRLVEVKNALGVTINDVMLAMCSGALRRYLDSHGALPKEPLVALVPVSFRDRTGGESGNAITLAPATLATHLDDPQDRVELIHESMNRVKARLAHLSPLELMEYGLLITLPLVVSQLTNLAGRIPPSYNLVVSNVPGPDKPLYWNGARMTGMYPLSLLPDGYAINITNASYNGWMNFGVTADRRALPGIQRLIDHLEDALSELEEVSGL